MKALILKFQLNGQAAYLFSVLKEEDLKFHNAVTLVLNAIYQRDALTVI